MKEFIKDYNSLWRKPELIVVGCSAGGIEALKTLLSGVPLNFCPAIAIVQHVGADIPQALSEFFQFIPNANIKEAEDKEPIASGIVYFAPAGYHLLVSRTKTFQLSVEDPVNYSRPCIDILFETAAEAYRENLLGIILTGANNDGAKGLLTVQKFGGQTLVQTPDDAEFPSMPAGALEKVPEPNGVMTLEEIQQLLQKFGKEK